MSQTWLDSDSNESSQEADRVDAGHRRRDLEDVAGASEVHGTGVNRAELPPTTVLWAANRTSASLQQMWNSADSTSTHLASPPTTRNPKPWLSSKQHAELKEGSL